MPIIPAAWQAEVGESFEPGKQRLQYTKIAPLHCSPHDRERPHLKKRKEKKIVLESVKKIKVLKRSA